ncbi:MAG: hypothetical protein P1V35_01010 [Planctomycetota bacterium]|nr:hypothetical protein [Planctomycetota bacterium]
MAITAQQLAVHEVLDLHEFFEDWLSGRGPNTPECFARLSRSLDSEFEIITPDGQLISRENLIDGLSGGFGSRGPEFRLWVQNTRARMVEEGLCLVTYEEWQATDGVEKGRLSSALLRCTPQGICTWIHVHETALP